MKLANRLKKCVFMLAAVAALGAAGLALTGCGRQAAAEAENQTLYTCGMHPQVVQDKPGNCPICGMKLTPMRKPDAGAHSQAIAVDPVTVQNMGIRTAEVTRGPLRRAIRTVGTIEYNETSLAEVTMKFRGWIEKLLVDATGQQVHRGDPLFEVYSPDLYSAQREYLLATSETPGERAGGSASEAALTIANSARTKLQFFDVSDEQIAELARTREPKKALQMTAPQDGFVVEKAVVEGQMVEPGMKLYRLADLGLVWVQAQIYEQDLPFVQLGQEATVTLSYLPDREFRGRVTYIYPNIDEKTRTAQVRMEFHNPGYFLKPGMFATVKLTSELEPSVVLAPDMAILRSGERNTVFVALAGGKFEPRNVVLGPPAEDGNYQIVSGLEPGERIVTSGQFLLDSESQLREATRKMMEPGEPGVLPAAAPGSLERSGAKDPAQASAEVVKYICPMPEHVSIQYDHPGKCSICGMTLVPVGQKTLEKLQPGGKLLYFTCPMPEHNDVRREKPGKCPKCGMTLIPVMAAPPVPQRSAAEPPEAPATALYTCPMASHAHIVSDQPGECPECEMPLVPTSAVKHGTISEAKWRQR